MVHERSDRGRRSPSFPHKNRDPYPRISSRPTTGGAGETEWMAAAETRMPTATKKPLRSGEASDKDCRLPKRPAHPGRAAGLCLLTRGDVTIGELRGKPSQRAVADVGGTVD